MKTAVRGAPRRMLHLRIMTTMVLLIGMAATAIGASAPARAAAVSYAVNFGGWEVGGFVSSTGHLVYCVEPGAAEPSGPQQAPTPVETLPAYASQARDGTGWNGSVAVGPISGDALRKMNWLLTTNGQTTDANMAAVVQIAIWMLRYDSGTAPWLDHHFGWIAAHGGTGHLSHARVLLAEAEAAVGPHPAPTPAAPLTISLDPVPGSGRVDYPAGTTALRIEGGRFADGSSTLVIADGEAGSAPWTAALHSEGWQREHRVAVSGDWRQDRDEWPASVTLHPSTDLNQQSLGSMIGPMAASHSVELEPASAVIDSVFSPVLTTRSEQPFVERGSGRFADRVTLSVAEGSTAWASRSVDGGAVEFAPVVADGVLYGPFSQPPALGDEAPPGAPVAGRARIVADRGPGEYRAELDTVPEEAGYFTWVWRIDETAQRPEVRSASLLPDGYAFADRYGLAEEGQTVASTLRWSTALASRELPLDGLVLRDRIESSLHHGAWLRDADGARVPARIRLTAYGLDSEPVRAAAAPGGAREIAHSFVELSGVGVVDAEPIRLPFETRGWVTVQACLLDEDQPEAHRGRIAEWCDDFGVPAETARVTPPVVRTEAQPEVVIGGAFRDIAIVAGPVPEGAELGFAYYLAPEAGAPRYDEQWAPMFDEQGKPVLWTQEELSAMTEEERCLAQPVATTSRVAVRGAGRVASPEVIARSAGVGYWVEDLSMPHPETGERVEIHRGACGLENERTSVLPEKPGGPGKPAKPAAVPGPPTDRLPSTGRGADARFALLGAVPLAGAGLLLLRSARAKRG